MKADLLTATTVTTVYEQVVLMMIAICITKFRYHPEGEAEDEDGYREQKGMQGVRLQLL